VSKNDFSDLSSQLSVLLAADAGEKLKIAEDLSKDKEKALDWLAKLILTTRQMLFSSVSKDSTDVISLYLNVIKSLQRTHILLSTTNVNTRFTLETVLLSLKY
jgi:3'-phosphoadenosine 5'-phosphosulfate sulfotransferase (PAPS reductase)/FAD synthetase